MSLGVISFSCPTPIPGLAVQRMWAGVLLWGLDVVRKCLSQTKPCCFWACPSWMPTICRQTQLFGERRVEGEISASYQAKKTQQTNKKSQVLLPKLHLNTSVMRIAHLTVKTCPCTYPKFGLEKSSLFYLFLSYPFMSQALITYLKRNFLICFKGVVMCPVVSLQVSHCSELR